MQKKTDRRTFIAAAGATAATVALAGCSGGGDDDDNGGTSGDAEVPDEVDTYLNDNSAKLYEGSAVDETGSDSVSISVGAGDQGLAFDPPAVIVSTGTTVTWEWTGEGGAHNVVAADSAAASFDSGDQQEGSDITFEYTFESAGNNPYYCTPHQGLGMHGAVIVEE